MTDIWKISNNYKDARFKKYEYQEHNEQSVNIRDLDNTNYEFIIQDQNDYIHYNQGYLCVQLQILKNDGTNITAADNVTFVNTGNLFTKAELRINNVTAEYVDNPDLARQVLGLANFTEDYLKGEASNMLYYPDTSDTTQKYQNVYIGVADQKLDTVENINKFLKNVRYNTNYNDGFAKRSVISKNSNIFKIWIPLRHYFAFLNTYDNAMSQLVFRFTFTRNTSENMLIADDGGYKVSFKDLTMWLPHVIFTDEFEVKYLPEIQQTFSLDWTTFRLFQVNNLISKTGSCIVNTALDRVEGVYVIPQLDNRSNNIKKNNMIFDNLNITQAHVRANNQKYPDEDYNTDFSMTTQNYNRQYKDFLASGLNTNNSLHGPLIDYLSYGSLYPIFYFDTSAHSYITNINSIKLEFFWQLKEYPASSYRFYFVVLEKRRAELNMSKHHFKMLQTLNV